MAEKERFRERQFKLWLLQEEFDILTDKAKQYKISKADFLRSCMTQYRETGHYEHQVTP